MSRKVSTTSITTAGTAGTDGRSAPIAAGRPGSSSRAGMKTSGDEDERGR